MREESHNRLDKPYKWFVLQEQIDKKLCIHCKHCVHDNEYMCGLYRDKVANRPIFKCDTLRKNFNSCGFDGEKWEQHKNIMVLETQEELVKAERDYYGVYNKI